MHRPASQLRVPSYLRRAGVLASLLGLSLVLVQRGEAAEQTAFTGSYTWTAKKQKGKIQGTSSSASSRPGEDAIVLELKAHWGGKWYSYKGTLTAADDTAGKGTIYRGIMIESKKEGIYHLEAFLDHRGSLRAKAYTRQKRDGSYDGLAGTVTAKKK